MTAPPGQRQVRAFPRKQLVKHCTRRFRGNVAGHGGETIELPLIGYDRAFESNRVVPRSIQNARFWGGVSADGVSFPRVPDALDP